MIRYRWFVLFIVLGCIEVQAQEDLRTSLEKSNPQETIDSLTEKSKHQSLIPEEYNTLIMSYSVLQQYSNALVYSNKMIDYCESKLDTNNLIQAINRKAESLIDLSKIEEGIRFSEEKSKIFRVQDSTQFQLFCFKLGMMYFEDAQYEKAYETYQKITIPKFRELSHFTHNFALVNMGLKNYDTAIVYLDKVLVSATELNDTININRALLNISVTLSLKKSWDQAYIYLDSIDKAQIKYLPLHLQKGIFRVYYGLHHQKQELEIAAVYLDSVEIMNDSIFNTKLNEKINELEVSYSREKVLKHKTDFIDSKLEKSEKQIIWGVIFMGILIILSICIIVYLRFQNIKNERDKAITEQQLLRSQMTPHFIFNSLSSIQGMILNKEDSKASNYLSKFSKLFRLILENSRNKTVSLENELKTLNYYLELQNIRFQNRFTHKIIVDKEIDIENIYIPPMIIQPFVENITEHAFNILKEKGEISIEIKKYQNYINCKVIDNGIGVNGVKETVLSQKKSLSTTITSERLEYLAKKYKTKASISIEDRSIYKEQGTIVSLNIPITELDND